MKHVYLLAGRELDRLFGFRLELIMTHIPIKMSEQEVYIADTIDAWYQYKPTVRDVLIVGNNKGHGLVGRVNVHTKKRLSTRDVSPMMNSNIKLDGNYRDELKNYLIEENEADKIVIARSGIASTVKNDMERLVGKLYLKECF